jgi:hypothetical protein
MSTITEFEQNLQTDQFGYVHNTAGNFKIIAESVFLDNVITFPWTDEEGSVFKILMNYILIDNGAEIDQIFPCDRLYVAIERKGQMFGFAVRDSEMSDKYILEKLAIEGNITGRKIAELVREVMKNLYTITQ